MACFISTGKYSVFGSSSLSRPSKWRPKITTRRPRVRIPMAMKMPDPAFDPNDPFGQKLLQATADNPEALKESYRTGRPPLIDKVVDKETKKKMIDDYIKYSPLYFHCHSWRTRPPPDIPSSLLDNFVIYIGLPLVSLVTELVIAQLFYLNNKNPYHPVYLYINSTGTSRDDGQKVALEDQGLIIYDVMMFVFNEIRTVNLGVAAGQSCLLLAAGEKGKRYMLPNSQASMEELSVFASGQMAATDIDLRAKEAVEQRDVLVDLFSKHTGNSRETILKAMYEKKTMNPKQAIEFGVADQVIEYPERKLKRADKLSKRMAVDID